MLYRARGHVLLVLPPREGLDMLTMIRPVRDRRASFQTKKPVTAVQHAPRPHALLEPGGPAPDPTRPRPGLWDRVWDHDPAKLYSNVYRLGPASTYDLRRLLEHLAWLRSRSRTPLSPR